MCGGNLEVVEGTSIAECDYCGTKQPVPKSMDENMQNLFNRANTLRIKSEFDKAEKLYEKIIQADSTQSEAYWGLILCKYGIEYVDDPVSFKKIPTCHRASYDSIIADDDYKSAIEYADLSQRVLYEAQAKEIDRIQKEILALAQKEETYDVFICYKETDSSGRRTQDSVIANDIYYQLTNQGFKTFYAAITLEGKLGSAYEPVIFAALNSAKVMLSIGTKPEYFNAVWVKNEWSRFLKIIQKDRSKLLIPCYRDMDAYELPEEFAHLQAQDMSKIGFINDLVRGIEKVVKKDEPKQTVIKEAVIQSGNANIAPLLKRAFMFLEDGDWKSANEYCEKVLDIDPECGEAYLGKLMAELKVRKQESLKELSAPFDGSGNYQKVIRFANEKLKNELTKYVNHINTRNEEARLEGIYVEASRKMRDAKSESDFKVAADYFGSILEYKDSSVLEKKCLEDAEITRKDEILTSAKADMNCNNIEAYNKAITKLKLIPTWRNSNELLQFCENSIEEIKLKERKAIQRKRIIRLIALSVFCMVIAFVVLLNTVIIPMERYNSALSLMESGNFEEAILAFEALDGYKDSIEKIDKCSAEILEEKYNQALMLMNEKMYQDAISAFEVLSGYKDSSQRIIDINYNIAVNLMNDEKYIEAYTAFLALNGYKDSNSKVKQIQEELILNASKGDTILLGKYEQDNNESNGEEVIEWIVLETEEKKLLLISKYGLDYKKFDETYEEITWETCTLRKWLNNDFITKAFSEEEKTKMIMTTLINNDNKIYGTNGGKSTTDKVFLLSIDEVEKYYYSNEERKAYSTSYVNSQGENSIYTSWWLRSSGMYPNFAAIVYSDGEIGFTGRDVNSVKSVVRPAMWISFE